MQHWWKDCQKLTHFGFQYPRSDRRRCNQPHCRSKSSTPSHFQYPRSDRRRCNSTSLPRRSRMRANLSVSSVGSEAMQPRAQGDHCLPHAELSVSSVGSEAMQRGWRCPGGRQLPPFSILGRIGGDATRGPRPVSARPAPLSVSSVGSEAMQPEIHRTKPRSSRSFQYPRSDRRRCNPGSTTTLPIRRNALSVSSVGSEAMQPRFLLLFLPSFSYFQYPRSDRRRCNHELGTHVEFAILDFQYPRSDRRRCNPLHHHGGRDRLRQPFSILGRIGGDAT